MRQHPNSLMIFAAGFGTRMGELTRARPKPLINVGGKALLDHALDPALEAGLDPVLVNAHYLSDQIETHLTDSPAQMVFEDPILETGGGLRAALPTLGAGPVLTMNSDAVWLGPNPYTLLQKAWAKSPFDILLLCVPKVGAIGHNGEGDFVETAAGVQRGAGLVYTGAQVVNPHRLAEIPETVFSLNSLWDLHLESGTLGIVTYPGQWCDVGRPESIQLAETLLGGALNV